MELLVREPRTAAQVSIVLADWSCRESFHVLDYLAEQTAPRDSYEILWLEFYGRRAPELLRRVEAARAADAPLPVDTHGVLGMPPGVCHHRHALYNLGILLASGRIVCIMDSDALVRPGFVASIIREFQERGPIALRYDEVRNDDTRFRPFRRPSFDAITGYGCVNWLDGRPLGLCDGVDPLCARDHDACLCALREDLIAIGGADLHHDYLGDRGTVAEMTFRLAGHGRPEVWHRTEWLYRVGDQDRGGENPADPLTGRRMVQGACARRAQGTVLPLLESPAIARTRGGARPADEDIGKELLPRGLVAAWGPERPAGAAPCRSAGVQSTPPWLPKAGAYVPPTTTADPILGSAPPSTARPRMFLLMAGLLWHDLRIKLQVPTRLPSPPGLAKAGRPITQLRSLAAFVCRVHAYHRDRLLACWRHLRYARALGAREVILYGDGVAARMLCALAPYVPLTVRAIVPFCAAGRPHGAGLLFPAAAAHVMIVPAAFTDTTKHLARLAACGVDRTSVVTLR